MFRDSVVAMFKAIDASDWPALRQFYADGCVYDRPGFEIIEGIDALLDFYECQVPIRSGVHTLEHVIQEKGRITASGTFKGTLRTGTPILLEFMDLYVFDESKIQFRKTFFYTELA